MTSEIINYDSNEKTTGNYIRIDDLNAKLLTREYFKNGFNHGDAIWYSNQPFMKVKFSNGKELQ